MPPTTTSTTSARNTLALRDAIDDGLSRLALVGMSCQSSVPPIMWAREAGKVGKPMIFNIGLLCSKTFDEAFFEFDEVDVFTTGTLGEPGQRVFFLQARSDGKRYIPRR